MDLKVNILISAIKHNPGTVRFQNIFYDGKAAVVYPVKTKAQEIHR